MSTALIADDEINAQIARWVRDMASVRRLAPKTIEAYQRGNVYCATKFAVDALTKSMRIDMLEHGIRVTGIHPGAAETEFSLVRFAGDAERAKKTYAGYEPLRAEDIADIAFFAATRPPHVVMNDIVVTPLAQANTAYIVKKPTEG